MVINIIHRHTLNKTRTTLGPGGSVGSFFTPSSVRKMVPVNALD